MSVSMWREVCWLDHIGSTNSDAVEEVGRGGAKRLIVATLEQRAGRGRMDRTWMASSGTPLAFSVLSEPRPKLPQQGWLSLLVGMAVHTVVDGLATELGRVQLEWPNDMLIDGRKVCEILSERAEHRDGARAVIGVGINVLIGEDQLPVPTATSLRVAGLREDPRELLEPALEHSQPLYEHWQDVGEVRDKYQRCCASIGTPLRIVVDTQRIIEGIGHGVDEYGRLRVATASGIETFAVGDVIHARLAR